MEKDRLLAVGFVEPVRNAEYQLVTQLEAALEGLAKSPLFFSQENLSQMTPVPDLWSMLDRTDTVIRSAICHMESGTQLEARQVALSGSLGDIQALTGATRVTTQLIRILCHRGTPASGLAPLRRLIHAIIRQIRATASAIYRQDAEMARTAAHSFFETRSIAQDIAEIFTGLIGLLPDTMVRMLRAVVISLTVIAYATARIARHFRDAATSAENARRVPRVPYKWNESTVDELLPLPTVEV
jgi:hypothetical protein